MSIAVSSKMTHSPLSVSDILIAPFSTSLEAFANRLSHDVNCVNIVMNN